MSVSRNPSEAKTIRRIAVMGGGRWARILLTVLRGLLPAKVEILWITKHSRSAAELWLNSTRLENVTLTSEIKLTADVADGVVVATSSERHFELVVQCLQCGLPVLSEKPVATSAEQTRVLSSLARVKQNSEGSNERLPVVGVHLEFLLASFLMQFRTQIVADPMRSIDIEWMDPWTEYRNGELKHAEMLTEMMFDQFPHCWSVAQAVSSQPLDLELFSVSDRNEGWRVELKSADVDVRCHMSRRAKQRIRRVIINDGDAELDFAIEPGEALVKGQRVALSTSLERPLSASLRSFLEVIEGRADVQSWPLGIDRLWPAVQLSLVASEQMRLRQESKLRDLGLPNSFDPECEEQIALLVDVFLPRLATDAFRTPVVTAQQQREFAEKCVEILRSET